MAYANGSSVVKLDVDPTLRPDTLVFRGDYRVMAPLQDPKSNLFRGQDSLPALPVPELSASLSAYLEAVAANSTAEQLEKARTDAYAFLAPTGLGPALQERLIARRDEYSTSSWLQNWWNRYSYLEYREPVVVYVSYFFHFVDDAELGSGPLAAIGDPMLERAAVLTRATLDVRRAVRDKSAAAPTGAKPGE
jgi:carnitine O-acetyltransferase